MEEILKFLEERGYKIHNSEFSTYIKLSSSKSIRISNHISTNNPGKYLNILTTIDDKYVVALKHNIFIVNSSKKLYDFIWSFIISFEALNTDSDSQIKSLKSENEKLNILNRNLMSGAEDKGKIKRQKEELTKKEEVIKAQKDEISKLKIDIQSQKEAIDEAVNLIKTLTEDPNSRDLLYSKDTGKTYYLDNFPDTEREIINECIKNYK